MVDCKEWLELFKQKKNSIFGSICDYDWNAAPSFYTGVQSTISWVDYTWWTCSKACRTQKSVGKVLASVFCDTFIDYLKKGETINSDYSVIGMFKIRNCKKTASIWTRKTVSFIKTFTVSQINENDRKIIRIFTVLSRSVAPRHFFVLRF